MELLDSPRTVHEKVGLSMDCERMFRGRFMDVQWTRSWTFHGRAHGLSMEHLKKSNDSLSAKISAMASTDSWSR